MFLESINQLSKAEKKIFAWHMPYVFDELKTGERNSSKTKVRGKSGSGGWLCVRCTHGTLCPNKCVLLKSRLYNPSRYPGGSLTDPHPKFLQTEPSAFFFSGFLTDSLVGDGRPIFSFF